MHIDIKLYNYVLTVLYYIIDFNIGVTKVLGIQIYILIYPKHLKLSPKCYIKCVRHTPWCGIYTLDITITTSNL